MNKKAFSLYIHIPFCISKCTYCDFFSIKCNKDTLVPDSYIQALKNEISFRIKEYGSKLCKSVYIGGGTPSLLSIEQFSSLFDYLSGCLEFTKNYEFTVEMNPDDITQSLIGFFNNSIVTRISCGIQSLDQKVLEYVKRRAGVKENLSALKILKENWKKSLSLDLISALPFEKEDSFINNLKTIIDHNPDHISLYSLTLEEETPLGKEVFTSKLPYDFDKADSMWLKGKTFLEQNGYAQYEISNFCKKGKECRHNLSYWKHEDYIGAGSGGTGTVYEADGSGKRWTNTTDIERYILTWQKDSPSGSDYETVENIDKKTSIFEYFMMGLRKTSGISAVHFKNIFNQALPSSIIKQFQEWNKKALVSIKKTDGDVIYSLNSQGLLFLNQFLSSMEL